MSLPEKVLRTIITSHTNYSYSQEDVRQDCVHIYVCTHIHMYVCMLVYVSMSNLVTKFLEKKMKHPLQKCNSKEKIGLSSLCV